ncbi:MAG: hypothetical protein NC911_05680, partial [Candidatus Omnitrophica bacterium]|nr:hypothetical protein [Candidatus Omnitrophota bacterium]
LHCRIDKVSRGGPGGPVLLVGDLTTTAPTDPAYYNTMITSNNHSPSLQGYYPIGGNWLFGDGSVKWVDVRDMMVLGENGAMRPKGCYSIYWSWFGGTMPLRLKFPDGTTKYQVEDGRGIFW